MNPTTNRRGLVCATTAAICAVLLAGCSAKPPGCDSPQVLKKLQDSVPAEAAELVSGNIKAAGIWDRPAGLRAREQLTTFIKSVKVELGSITSNGYEDAAKRHLCSADISLTMLGNSVRTTRIQYSTQGTTDGKDFILESPQYQLILTAVGVGFVDYQLQQDNRAREEAVAKSKESATACEAAKMQNYKVELQKSLETEEKEAAEKGWQFKGLSPVAMEEWEEKHRKLAQDACR